MAIITLISDFGLKDHYVSSVKGAILKQLPTATIIDISHQIEKYNIQGAAFILKETFSSFPPKTVHIIGLLTELKNTGGYVAVEHAGQFFIAADNGVFSLLFDEAPKKVFQIPMPASVNLSFPVRDIFAIIACKLAGGAEIESVGIPKEGLLQRLPFRATTMGSNIRGSIVYIDSYDNVITNVDRALFNQVGKGQPFVIELARGTQIEKISREYNDVPEGEILALFNASNYLEIAMRNGKLSSLLGMQLNHSITIRF
jgi:S-adenosyl-L-methionine hydrolase (adenosine-forming)